MNTISINRTQLLRHLAKYVMSSPLESVVESIGSILPFRSQMHQQVPLETLDEEVIIQWNGPSISDSKGLIKKALDLKFESSNWNFVHVNPQARSAFAMVSKVVKTISDRKSCSFMHFD